MPYDYRIWRTATPGPLASKILKRVHDTWRRGQGEVRDWLEYRLVKEEGDEYADVTNAVSELIHQRLVEFTPPHPLRPTLKGLLAIAEAPTTQQDLDDIGRVIRAVHESYAPDRTAVRVDQLAEKANLDGERTRRLVEALRDELGLTDQDTVVRLDARALSWTTFEAFLYSRAQRRPTEVGVTRPINIRAELVRVVFRDLGPYAVGDLFTGPLTVLVGANAAGKTTALRALALLRDLAKEGLAGLSSHEPFFQPDSEAVHLSVTADLVRPGAPPERVEWCVELGTRGPIHVASESLVRVGAAPATIARFERGVGAWMGPHRELVPHAMNPDSLALVAARDPECHYALLALRQALTQWVVLLERTPRGRPELFPATTESPAWEHLALHDRAWSEFEVSVRSVAGITALHRVAGDLLVEERRGQGVPIDRVSAGLYRVIDILARAHAPDPPPLLAIDEIENHIHADMAGRLIDALRAIARRTQVILTTHSGRVLQNVQPNDVLWVRRGATGSEIVPVATDPTMSKLLARHDLAELALAGYFGARL